MATIKTSELSGAALDWAVAKCEGITEIGAPEGISFEEEFILMHDAGDFAYSTDWSEGGPIIERESIDIEKHSEGYWEGSIYAYDNDGWGTCTYNYKGPTPLIAAMRCYVASKLGDTVEIPDELL